MLTTCRSEVSDSTCPAAGLPRLPGTLVTRIASGSNTTDLAASDPDGLEIPTADCSASTAAFVSHEKWPAAGSEVGVAFIARGPAPPRDAVCPQAYARRLLRHRADASASRCAVPRTGASFPMNALIEICGSRNSTREPGGRPSMAPASR